MKTMVTFQLEALAADGSIAADWAEALRPVADTIARLGSSLHAEARAGAEILPTPDRVLRAFQLPMHEVRVLILGQDPYPTPGHAIGLAFAVDRAVRPVPRSLHNVFRELHDDLGIAPAMHGDLSSWQSQGVLLLNRVLTVQAGRAGSHRRRGWEEVTECALRALAAAGRPPVAVLWGNDARRAAPLLPHTAIIESAHPSPLSASRGFFGSRPFSRANELLLARGEAPVDWTVR